MATTLQQLIDQILGDLADTAAATFNENEIEQWTRDAIADYSHHFNKTVTDTISTSLNDRTYDLPALFMDMITVEYPTGEDPPEYLKRRSHQHESFWIEDGYYDVVKRDDDSDVDEIWISEKPAAAETITVTFTASHDNSIGTGTAVTVPVRHHHVLRNYVFWQATLQLAAAEEAAPTSNSSLLMSQLAQNSDRARRAYLDALAKALFAEARARQVSWNNKVEEATRIY